MILLVYLAPKIRIDIITQVFIGLCKNSIIVIYRIVLYTSFRGYQNWFQFYDFNIRGKLSVIR